MLFSLSHHFSLTSIVYYSYAFAWPDMRRLLACSMIFYMYSGLSVFMTLKKYVRSGSRLSGVGSGKYLMTSSSP